jgi:hypothetical protein
LINIPSQTLIAWYPTRDETILQSEEKSSGLDSQTGSGDGATSIEVLATIVVALGGRGGPNSDGRNRAAVVNFGLRVSRRSGADT